MSATTEPTKAQDKADEITTDPKKKRSKLDKMQEDFSGQVAAAIPAQEKIAKAGNLEEAIENLLLMEKQTRQAEDHLSTAKLAVAIVRFCHETKNTAKLNEILVVLSKRRGQFRNVIQDFVKEAMTYLPSMEKTTRLELIATLRTITEGKMFVEIERARLTRILAQIKEEEGKIGEAADILQEIQVETYGQMEREEKTDFILEQVRLCLDKKDFIKAQILSNKILKRTLTEPTFQDLKIRFYSQMIRYFLHENKFLDVCKSFMAMYDTPKVKSDENSWKEYLRMSVLFVCLSSFDNEQSDLAHRIALDKNLEQLPAYKQLLTSFLTHELISWTQLQTGYKAELDKAANWARSVSERDIWTVLRTRVVQHNLRVLEKYYTRMRMTRVAQLLDLSVDEAEQHISDLVVSKGIFAKIDRPTGIISFRRRKDAADTLNEWSHSISDLLNLINDTCHLISRENMVHKLEA